MAFIKEPYNLQMNELAIGNVNSLSSWVSTFVSYCNCHFNRLGYRFHAVVLRQRFEENRHLTDAVQIQTLIDNAEDELFKGQHYQPLKCIYNFKYYFFSLVIHNVFSYLLSDAYSPGGVAYGRTLKSPDWVVDLWHPDEKAQYPEFFARRAQLKKEYVEYWEKKYGKAEEPHHHWILFLKVTCV